MGIYTVKRGFAMMTAIAVLGGTAACEHPNKQTGKSEAVSPSASKSAQPADNGIAAKSETEIVKAAHDALAHARSVHLKGAFAEDGKRTMMDMRIGQNACDGSVKSPSTGTNARVYVRCVGRRTYMRSPEMIRAVGGAAMARLVGDRWFYSSKDHSNPFDGMTKPADFAENLTPDGHVSKGKATTVNGIPAIELRDSGSVMYVATTGAPYPIRLEPDPPKRGEGLDLLGYNAPLDVVAPQGAMDLDHPTG
jgi:hypothetical protein